MYISYILFVVLYTKYCGFTFTKIRKYTQRQIHMYRYTYTHPQYSYPTQDYICSMLHTLRTPVPLNLSSVHCALSSANKSVQGKGHKCLHSGIPTSAWERLPVNRSSDTDTEEKLPQSYK